MGKRQKMQEDVNGFWCRKWNTSAPRGLQGTLGRYSIWNYSA